MSAPWTAEENIALLSDGRKVRTTRAEWHVIAKQFPGRTMESCRQQFYKLRALPNGAVMQRKPYPAREPRRTVEMQAPQALPAHTCITAAFFGDPLPGRSALDQRAPADGPTVKLMCDLPRRSPVDQMRAGLA